MEIKIEKNFVTIKLPLNNPPTKSSTGKSLIIAGTGGFKQSDTQYKGKTVNVSCNLCIKADKE